MFDFLLNPSPDMVAEGRSHAIVAFVYRLRCATSCSLGSAALPEHLAGGWLSDGHQEDCGLGCVIEPGLS